jgi:predicted NBD/HSP70 family sugar kinase
MRRINPTEFRIAHRGTSREINRQIALNLVRTRQPISRAELARLMGVRRGAISRLVQDLLDTQQIFEGAKGETKRGRKPQYLFIETRQRCVVAVDISASRTLVQVSDLLGHPLRPLEQLPTPADACDVVPLLARGVAAVLADKDAVGECLGIGVSIAGLVDTDQGRLLRAPTLGWVDVALRDPLQEATGLPVVVENNVKASVLAQLWAVRSTAAEGPVVFVNVSDGVGVGIALDGQLVRGARNGAGEFGHIPISMDGPLCGCGLRGCWETYASVGATVARYLGRSASWPDTNPPDITMEVIVARAHAGEAHALDVLQQTGIYVARGLSMVVKAIQPTRIYMSGEITDAWDIVLPSVRRVLGELTLVPEDADIEIVVVPAYEQPRLRGAAALVTSPAFAAPVVA